MKPVVEPCSEGPLSHNITDSSKTQDITLNKLARHVMLQHTKRSAWPAHEMWLALLRHGTLRTAINTRTSRPVH